MTTEELESIKAKRRARTSGWPPPHLMASLIVDGIAAGRYFIIQEGPGQQGWFRREMQQRWADPEAFLADDSSL